MKNNILSLIELAAKRNVIAFEQEAKKTLNRVKESKLQKFGSIIKKEFLNTKGFNKDTLRSIVETKNARRVRFIDGSTARIDFFSANTLVKIYDALISENQEKMMKTLGKNEAEYKKILNFALSHTG